MRSSTHRFSLRPIALALVGALLIGTVGLVGCSNTNGGGGQNGSGASVETTQGQFPADRPNPAQAPPPPMLRTPETAVYSYLLWISYAYRVLDSNVATLTFSPYEEVRVDSYVQLNRQEGRAIDQRLLELKIKSVASTGTTATVAARESWAYRYIDMATVKYKSATLKASYDSTYTVVKGNTGWVVDSVKAKSVGGSPK